MDTFKKQLNYEIKCQPLADKVYNKLYGGYIKRYDWDDTYGREMQRRDIDVSLGGNNHTILSISEKFRRDDYGDFLIEVYSMYPRIDGWGRTSQADLYAYFVPNKLYMVSTWAVRRFMEEYRSNIDQEISHMINTGMSRTTIWIKDVLCELIKIPTITNGKSWEGICLSINWDDLEKFNIKYNFYAINWK